VLSAYAYVGVKMVAAAIQKAGAYDGDKIATALQGLNYDGGLIGTYAYTSDYHGGPGASAFKPVSFKGSDYAAPVF